MTPEPAAIGRLPLRLADAHRAYLSYYYRHWRKGKRSEAKPAVLAWLKRHNVRRAVELDPAGLEQFIWFLDHTEPE